MTAALQLLLVRHGVTDWNESGRLLGRIEIGLNTRGRTQAEAVAAALRGVSVEAVISSPQRRTQETAAAVAAAHGLRVKTEPALDEVWLGRWQGKTFAEIANDPELQRYIEDPTYACDAIESAADIHQRVVEVVEALRRDAHTRTIVLVSHGDPLRILLAHHLGMALRHFRRLTVSPASVSVLRLDGSGSRLLALNWKPGVPGLLEILAE